MRASQVKVGQKVMVQTDWGTAKPGRITGKDTEGWAIIAFDYPDAEGQGPYRDGYKALPVDLDLK